MIRFCLTLFAVCALASCRGNDNPPPLPMPPEFTNIEQQPAMVQAQAIILNPNYSAETRALSEAYRAQVMNIAARMSAASLARNSPLMQQLINEMGAAARAFSAALAAIPRTL